MLDVSPRKDIISSFDDWRKEPLINQAAIANQIVDMLRKKHFQIDIENQLKVSRHIIVRLGEINGLARRGAHKGLTPPVVPDPIIYDIDMLPPHYVLSNPLNAYSKEEIEELTKVKDKKPMPDDDEDDDPVRRLTPKGTLQANGDILLTGVSKVIGYYMGLLAEALDLDITEVHIHHSTGSISQKIKGENYDQS